MAECKLHELNERMRADPVQTIAKSFFIVFLLS
jgi:hypothetical protein